MDCLDKNIIKHLQRDARLSLREIGRLLNVPHTTIFTRLNKLVKRGIIKRFQAVIHPHEVGMKIGMLVIEPPASLDDPIASQIAQMEQIMKVFRSEDGRIFAKAVWDPSIKEPLKDICGRLYGYDYKMHPIGDVLKYEHHICDESIDCIEMD